MEKHKDEKMLSRFKYSADEVIEKPFNWKQMLRLFSYMKPYRKGLLPLSILMVLLNTSVKLIIPILIGVYTLDIALENKDGQLLAILVSVIAALYILSYVAWENGYDLFQYQFINFYETKQLKELMQLLPEQNIKKFYENTLRSLSYPKSKDEEDLLHTLIVYLDYHCEISKTAKKLFVHRNTVKYRIAKCEEILGYSVHDSENSLHLRMALMMRTMFTK